MKYAVYVEGQSEMYFVADVLQKYSNYDPVQCGFKCICLQSDMLKEVGHPQQGDDSSQNYYQIVNVNNDNKVISKLNKDIPNLIHKGFDIIIGLKDVYGQAYKELVGVREVLLDKVEELYQIQLDSINANGADFRLHFAIMEYETWMLALIEKFVTSKSGNLIGLCHELNIDLSHDIEKTIYHPYVIVRKIYEGLALDYDKHEKDTFSFLNTLTIEDYEALRISNKCPSFTKFLDGLLCGAKPVLP